MTRETEQLLLSRARDVLENAWGVYSGIRVAAALLASDGTIHTGVNVENSSYGLTVCAERNAIFRAVGEARRDFSAMAIVSDSQYINSPCGACRQVMAEFSPDMEVLVQSPAGTFRSTVRELLPGAFTPKGEHKNG